MPIVRKMIPLYQPMSSNLWKSPVIPGVVVATISCCEYHIGEHSASDEVMQQC